MTDQTGAPISRTRWLWKVYLAAAFALAAGYYFAGSLGQNLILEISGFTSGIAVLFAIRLYRPKPALPWLLLAAAQLCFFAGDLTYAVIAQVLQGDPFPSVADVLYLAGYPLMAFGFGLLLVRRPLGMGWGVLLDAAILTSGLALVGWVALVDPVLADRSLPLLDRIVDVIYPSGDVLVIGIVACLLLGTEAGTPTMRLFALSLTAMLVADALYAYLGEPGAGAAPGDAFYLLNYALWGAAVLHPSMARPARMNTDREHVITPGRLAALTAAAMLAPIVMVLQGLAGVGVDFGPIAFFWVVIIGLVLACVLDLLRQQAADLRKRELLESRLRETSETLRGILDASPLAIVVVDRERRVRFWSRGAERLYGYSAEETLGQPPPIVPADSQDDVAPLLERVFAGESIVGEDVRQQGRDGSFITVRLYLAPVADDAGAVWGAISLNEDVRDLKRLEAELFEARKMESVGRLAGGIAHDFNNILTAIVGFADLSLAEPPGSDVRESLTGIRASAERAAGLTQQLLAFSRRQVLKPEVLDANAVVTGIESMLRRLIGEHVELRIELSAATGCVRVDRTQLEQVLLNLTLNGRDAMPDGGRLVVRTGRQRVESAPQTERREIVDGDYVTIAVSDTGHGIDAATRTRIFEPFFTTKDRGRGTGLGLATSYGIVKQSGGYVTVDSEPGRGTTFTLYFPVVAGEAVERSPERPGTAAESGRILLVEDEVVLRDLARRVLVRAGFEVIATSDPVQAVALSRERRHDRIDLLLTDVVMPGMRGPELARRLRLQRPSLRVLLTSGYAEEIVEAEDLEVAFLAKPFTPASLLAAVDDALRGSGPEQMTAPADEALA